MLRGSHTTRYVCVCGSIVLPKQLYRTVTVNYGVCKTWIKKVHLEREMGEKLETRSKS